MCDIKFIFMVLDLRWPTYIKFKQDFCKKTLKATTLRFKIFMYLKLTRNFLICK